MKIYLNFGIIFLNKHKNCITTPYFYAISCGQKSVISYLSISTLSNVHCTYIVHHWYANEKLTFLDAKCTAHKGPLFLEINSKIKLGDKLT